MDDLTWPFTRQIKVCVPAGSVCLMPQNLFHRRTRRLDDPGEWDDKQRFMWRFWLYRTTEPEASGSQGEHLDWHGLEDRLCRADLSAAGSDSTVVWDSVMAWMKGQSPPAPVAEAGGSLEALREQMHTRGEGNEVVRVGAAYKLALLGRAAPDPAAVVAVLSDSLCDERECVRRASAYGLIVLGEAGTAALLRLVPPGSAAKWVRKTAMFVLGEVAAPSADVVAALSGILEDTDRNSVHLRSTAAMVSSHV